MVGPFEGKVALVTGGTSGIGSAAVRAFGRLKARVVIADIRREHADSLVRSLNEIGAEAVFVQTDVSQPQSVERMVATTIDTFGRLDYAFNNAGIEGQQTSTGDCSEENWRRVIDINLTGVWLCMKYELPEMLKLGGGSIVNNSSVAGLKGFENLPAYVTSKHGLLGLTKAAALEYARKGIRVNAVCPGVIRTPMVDRVIGGNPDIEKMYAEMEPVGRMGNPDEVANVVTWLCSESASFVTGHAMVVDGGMMAG